MLIMQDSFESAGSGVLYEFFYGSETKYAVPEVCSGSLRNLPEEAFADPRCGIEEDDHRKRRFSPLDNIGQGYKLFSVSLRAF